ncbi:nuclear pore-associated protein 1 [Cervus elaphus]|uniref:nuclear pore-associated protein 1 n=1 Tax=Cervus elaphus TaxID=9860 RepID=UPI001CC2F1EC|nr:nuclear pore-associated protein 1 [Cervus elaphus]
MGNLLCKLVSALRRRHPLGRRSLVLRRRDAITSGRGHPAAPAPALHPGRRLLNQDRVPLSSGSYIAPKSWYPIQQAGYSRVGVLPLANLRELPKKKPVLSTRNSMMFGPSRTVRIPPPGRKITLLPSLPELHVQVGKAGKPVPTSHRPLPCAKESKAMVREERREVVTKEEGHTEAEGEANGKMSPYRSGAVTRTPRPQETGGLLPPLQCSPEPPNLLPVHPEDNVSEKAQVSRTKPSSQSPAICSDGTAGDGRPPSQPGPLASVLSAPSPCCSLLPERPVEEVLGEDHQPGSPESPVSGKALQREAPSDPPRRGSSPPGAAGSRRPCKRKMPPPLFLPLPPLLPPRPPPLPLPWGRSDLPPPPKLPGMTLAKTWGTLKQNMDRQRNRILKDARKAMRRRSTAPPAPGTTGCLAPVSHVLQVPPTTTDLADLSSRFPNLAGLPPCLTPYTDRVARHTAPSHSAIPADPLLPPVFNPIVGITVKEDAGTSCSARATPPFISDLSTPLSTPTLPFQPPSYRNESPTPMCVDSPPPLYLLTPLPDPPIAPPVPTEQPITSSAVPVTTTVIASASVTPPSPSDSGITDMDTTPPSQAVIFQSPPGIGVEQTHTAERSDTTGPFVPMVSCRASIFNYPFDSQTNPHPTFAATDEQQRASVLPRPPSGAPAAVFPGPPPGDQAAAIPGPSSGAPAAVFPGSAPADAAAALPGPPPGDQAAALPGPPPGDQAAALPGPPPGDQAAALPGPPPGDQAAALPGPPPGDQAAALPGPPPGDQSTSDSKENHYPYHMAVPGSENTAPSGSNAWTQASTYLPVELVNRVQPHRGRIMDSDLPDPLSSTTTINMQPAFVYSSGIFPRDVSATSGFGVDTTVPSTGDSSLLSASTTSGPLLMGPAASMAGGSFGLV